MYFLVEFCYNYYRIGGIDLKKVRWIFLLLVCFLFSDSVQAMSPNEVKVRGNVCGEEKPVELAVANFNGTLTTHGCYKTYKEAKEAMTTSKDINAEYLVIIENGMIVDAQNALIDYDQLSNLKYTEVYQEKNLNNRITYIASTTSTSDDAALLEVDYATKRIKIKVSDTVGWIRKYEVESSQTNILYDIVPITWAASPSYYKVTDTEIIHYLPGNLYNTKSTSQITLGPKPEQLPVGTYYSYDGHYFYKDLLTLLKDYKNNTYQSSVNANDPYYNYYMYLSFRSKTTYNADNINQYIKSRTSSSSKLYQTGENFINYQNKYGVNAALMLAIGINESGWGNSPIAQKKNNLFGLNAVDATPGESADYFKSVDDCIDDYAYTWLAYGYLQPGDYRFEGANLGNKGQGLNVHYASDLYWGEIAASIYYEFDKYYQLQDYNAYQLAVLKEDQNGKVYAYKTPGGEKVSNSFYQYKTKNSAILILEEVTGPKVNGSTTWYKIMSDPTLDSNLNYIGSSKSDPRIEYKWEQTAVYVPASYFQKINSVETGGEEPEDKPTDPPKPPENEDVAISTIVSEASYYYEPGKISDIAVGTKVEDAISKLSNHGATVTIARKDQTITSGVLRTGDKVTIQSGNNKETLEVIIYGDVDGDGTISAVDYVLVKNHIMGTNALSGVYQNAANVDKDNSISAVDYVNIKNYIMGNNSVIK